MQTHVLWCIWSKQQIQSKMLLNLYPTPIHKSAITNSLSKVCAGRCVLISSQLFVWKPWGGPSTQLASCSSNNSWFNLMSTTHWETLRTLCRFLKCLGWKTWVLSRRAGPSNGTVSATQEDRELKNIPFFENDNLCFLRYFINHNTRQTTWDDPRTQR